MRLKSLKLENYRQFKNETIDFAQGDDGKNVTIVLGQNGAGKTTIEQAFSWVLYGKTEFKDNKILNRDVAQDMVPGEYKSAKVKLCLSQGEYEYEITREQEYTVNDHRQAVFTNKAANFQIMKKGPNGISSFLDQKVLENEVQGILPQELSKYFFFDGERVESMARDITDDNRVKNFEDAVNGLLGLSGIISAIKHMKGRGSVIASYEHEYDDGHDARGQELTRRIDNAERRLEEIESELETCDSDIQKATESRESKVKEMKLYEDGAKLQNEKESLEKEVKMNEGLRSLAYKEVCTKFENSFSDFVSYSLIARCFEYLSEQKLGAVELPYVRKETIDYLLKRHKCLCGRSIPDGSDVYEHMCSYYDILPPKSLSTMASEFLSGGRRRINAYDDITEYIQSQQNAISKYDENIEHANTRINTLDKQLLGNDVSSHVAALQQAIRTCDNQINGNRSTQNKLNQEKGWLNKQIDNDKTERSRLNAKNEKNQKIELYLAYANRIYEDMNLLYKTEEVKVRERLQAAINEIFKNIYNGGLHIDINDKYRISVIDDRYNTPVESSDGQSISVVFSFIAAIIKLARENGESEDEGMRLLSSETYPLVMDAPLSTFDKERIHTVCQTIPKIAEQVVIFIKDTDGELARAELGASIGKSYYFDKVNEFETKIMKGSGF